MGKKEEENSNAETLSSQRKSREEEEKNRRVVAQGRKNPPFAHAAKDGAPSSSFVEWRYEENPRAQPGMAVPQVKMKSCWGTGGQI